VTGGDRPGEPELAGGCYFAPTIYDEVTAAMTICHEEILGPVLCVQTCETVDEAVALANDCDYGLAADIWTTDVDRAHTLAARLEAGIIWINCANIVGPWMSYGGHSVGGLGIKSGVECLHQFTGLNTVVMDVSGTPNTWVWD
jgi:acyl-CoA reductase-like NAD-dependent aldehyde dehydrogenase